MTEAGGKADDEDEVEEPIDMSFPKGHGWKAIVVYLISLPIMLPLYYTLPDTKKDKCKSTQLSFTCILVRCLAIFPYSVKMPRECRHILLSFL